jgi:hypothetical protein
VEGPGDVSQDEADEQDRERDRDQGGQQWHSDAGPPGGTGGALVTVTTARAATKTPTSIARYPFTDIRASSSRFGPTPTW